MKKRLSAILLACGLTVSMLSGTAFAAASGTDGTEVSAEQAATEAEEVESELAADVAGTQETEANLVLPAKFEIDQELTEDEKQQIEQSLAAYENQTIEAVLKQLSTLPEEQIEAGLDADDASTKKLFASWDQVREDLGEYEGTDDYDIAVEGKNVTYTLRAKYKEAEAIGSKVTITATIALKNLQSALPDLSWNVKETLGRAMAQAGENTAVGLINVFLVLFILTFVIAMFHYIPDGSRKKKELAAAEAAAPSPAPAEEEPAEEEASDDGEIAAVIAAAVAAYEGETGRKVPADGFVVRSIRRRGRKSNWQNA